MAESWELLTALPEFLDITDTHKSTLLLINSEINFLILQTPRNFVSESSNFPMLFESIAV